MRKKAIGNALRSVLTHRTIRTILRQLPLPQLVFQSLHFKGRIDIEVPGYGHFYMFHHGFSVENELYWLGLADGFEKVELEVWMQLAQHCGHIFDIGANTGLYSMVAGTVNPKAKIHAFEPSPTIARRLRENVEINNFDITVVEAGVSSVDGEMTFFEPQGDHAYSATLDPVMAKSLGLDRERSVPVVRFDNYVRQHGIPQVDLVKIDVERHEPDVLQGFGDILRKHRPHVLIEVLDSDIGKEVMVFFTSANYSAMALDGSFNRVSELGRRGMNYLLVSNEKQDQVRALNSRYFSDVT
jgi:FkbM family methyltransferase